ncbi:hypothetical protein [Enterovibrio sp. 27052020O]|uniref:hypothetical protein n=1 Tax=Enterovibrio sp. 27052020O TaxID=3241166 RepID=UPI003890525A
MAKFLLTYLGGNRPTTPEAGKQHFAEYQAWLNEIGERAISPANPLKATVRITPNGEISHGSQIAMSGFTIIGASDMEEAISMAKTCPFLSIGGTLEVSELVDMAH